VDGLVSAPSRGGPDWQGTFTRLCIHTGQLHLERRVAVGPGRGNAPSSHTSARNVARGACEVPAHFYFIGEKDHSYGARRSQGIILIEELFHYAVADEVTGGLRSSVSTRQSEVRRHVTCARRS